MLQLEHTTTVERLYLIQGYYIMPELLFEKRGTTLLPAASGGVSASVFIMTVTGLEAVSRYRVKITFDEEETVTISARDAAAFGFSEGSEVPEAVWEEFLKGQKSAAIAKCGKLLQDMDYSAKGLLDKLLRNGFPQEAAEYAVEKMQEAHYVDDVRYAATYLKYHLRDKSLKRIQMDLKAKGVPGDVVARVIREHEEEREGDIKESETEQAKRLLKKRRFDPDNPDPNAIRKQMAYLFGKGYGMDVIRRAMEELAQEDEESGTEPE